MFRFENKFAGKEVLYVLRSELGFSRKAITKLKQKENGIVLNGSRVTVRAVIGENDILEINCDDGKEEENKNLVPNGAMPEILFEDDYIIAVNKPAYMPTHPSIGHFDDTLANSLANYYRKSYRPFVFRAINRLDRNTSGTLLIAKDKLSSYKLGQAMQNGRIHKTYLAILCGRAGNVGGRIETYIRRKEESIIFREVCGGKCDGASLAVTDYRILAANENFSLAEASPLTGRTHQLRVHFSHIGHPILSDDLYGEKSDLIGRHALHSHKLSFPHPMSGKTITVCANLPEDMKKITDSVFEKEDYFYEQ